MARADFALTTLITAKPEQVKNLIADIEHIGKYHPMIIGVKEIAADRDSAGLPRRRYRVTDRMQMGLLRTKFTYLATTTSPSAERLYCEAFQSPGVHLIITYDFFGEGDQTRIEEQCVIEAPWALRGVVLRQAKAAHAQTMMQIKRYLESTNATGATLPSRSFTK